MLSINIDQITELGLDLIEKVDAAALPLLNELSQESSLRFIRPVDVRIRATVADATVLIDGSLSTSLRMACSRCLNSFDLKIDTDISVTAVPKTPSTIDGDADHDMELTIDDMDLMAFSGDRIDLDDEIAQQIIMALPFKPLCLSTCKGLCSRCGADLNQAPCHCMSSDEANPFSVLKALSLPKKQE